jgi:hypothetical protein
MISREQMAVNFVSCARGKSAEFFMEVYFWYLIRQYGEMKETAAKWALKILAKYMPDLAVQMEKEWENPSTIQGEIAKGISII